MDFEVCKQRLKQILGDTLYTFRMTQSVMLKPGGFVMVMLPDGSILNVWSDKSITLVAGYTYRCEANGKVVL